MYWKYIFEDFFRFYKQKNKKMLKLTKTQKIIDHNDFSFSKKNSKRLKKNKK